MNNTETKQLTQNTNGPHDLFAVIARVGEWVGILSLIPFTIDTATARGSELYCIAKNIASDVMGLGSDQYLSRIIPREECRAILDLIPYGVGRTSNLGLIRSTIEKELAINNPVEPPDPAGDLAMIAIERAAEERLS